MSKSLSSLNNVRDKLMSKFEMRNFLGNCLKFLGLTIFKHEDSLIICQKDLINKILRLFKMEDCKHASVPMQINLKLGKNDNEKCENLPYRQLIGCLMLGTRPDICYSVTYFSQYQNCYNAEHWRYLKQVLRYLKCTKNYVLKYVKSKDSMDSNILSAYVDADFANDKEDRKSITGFAIKMYNNIVFWKSKKQCTVSLSSAEAEYVALSSCVTECIFICNLLKEIMKGNPYPIKIFEDNQACIKMASTLETKRTNHIDVRHHFVRDCVTNDQIKIHYVPTTEQIADVLTKALRPQKFQCFRNKLNLFELN